ATKELRATRMTECMGMHSGEPCPCADGLDDFPDTLTRDLTLEALAGSGLVRHHKERRRRRRAGSLDGHVLTQDGAGRSRQGDRHLVTTLAHDPSKPEVRGNISDIERCHFPATKPAKGHEGKDPGFAESTLLEQ